jgi:hypothetical protein
MWKAISVCLGLSLVSCGTETGAEPVGTPAVEPGKAVSTPVQAEPVSGPQVYLLEGRVVDPWNDAVVGVQVRAVAPGQPESAQTLGTATTDKQGKYTLDLPNAGPYRLYARHAHQGFDRISSATLDRGAANQAIDMRLAGEGILGGVLYDAGGKPVVDTVIAVFRQELLVDELFGGDPSFDLDVFPLWAPILDGAYFQPGAGFQHLVSTTNSRGEFGFKGLIPGNYMIFSSAIGPGPWLSRNREWRHTGEENLELRSKICLLEVGVGLDGLPGSITGKEIGSRRLGPVEVFPSVPTESGPRPLLGRAVNPYGGERNVFGIGPGEYFARAQTFPPEGAMGGVMHAEGIIRIEEGDSLRRVNLSFAAVDRPTGRLRVSAQVPDGWETPPTFHLLSALTSQELECSEHTPYPTMRYNEWLDVPEGEYVIALFPYDDFDGHAEVIDLARCYRRVVVKAGEELEATLRSVPGGSLRLSLDADHFVLDRDLVFPEGMLKQDVRSLLSLFEQTIGAVITIVREDGGPALRLRLRDKLERLTLERRSMLPGEVFENFVPLDPGNYNLWAEAPGFESASVPFTVESGNISDVSLRLTSK